MDDSAIYLSYVVTEVFCVLFSGGIIIKANNNVGTELQMKHFRGMTLFFIMYLLFDGWWALGQGGLVPFSKELNLTTSTLGLVAVSLLILAWCIFVIYRIGVNNDLKVIKVLKGIHYSVAAADILLLVSSIFTKFCFYIDKNNVYRTNNGYSLHLVLVFIQLFGSGVFSYAQSFSDNQVKVRNEYRLPLLFIIIPSAAAVLESVLPLTPIVPLGTFLPILLAFIDLQNGEIYSDALTGLNNRRRMEIFLQDKIHGTSEAAPFKVYMIDVNDFKQVNDKYGHTIGDRTLQLVANALKNICDKHNGFCARYGGDEFILILSVTIDVHTALHDEVRQLREAGNGVIPDISLCSGCAECRSNTMTATQLIAEADKLLYINKQIYHSRTQYDKHC